MKIFLTLFGIFLFSGIQAHSTSYYGWAPNKEYSYHFTSQALTGIPDIRSQYSGLKISSKVLIQSFPDYSLRIKFVQPQFWTVNDESIPNIDGFLQIPPSIAHPQPIPQPVLEPLIAPFEVHLKGGVIETVFVPKSEPVVVTNLKKALLAQIQMDLSASREGSVQKLNHVVLPVETEDLMKRNVSFFSTMETSLAGDCETTYNVHPIPEYQARELEEQMRLRKIKKMEVLPGYAGQMTLEKINKVTETGRALCEGKQYYEISKNRNFGNCRERPVFSSFTGIRTKCDPATNTCKDLMNALSTTNYVVCGSPEEFIVRSVIGQQLVSSNVAPWETKEKMSLDAQVTLEIIEVKTSGYTPLPKPSEPKTKNNLFMEYPEAKIFNSKSISESRGSEPSPQEEQLKTLTGFYPIHPMPELKSSPKLMFPTSITKPELIRQVKELMGKVVKQTFKSPESCASSSDVAGYLFTIAKALRPLSLQELKEVREVVIKQFVSETQETQSIAKHLYADVMAMVGTNPAVALLTELIESGVIPVEYGPQYAQAILRHVKTPTPELLNVLFSLVKTSKAKSTPLFSVTCIGLSDLLHRACISPSGSLEFPTRIYGNFCNPETPFIKEQYITYLSTQLEQSKQAPVKEQIILIQALGKLGHYSAVAPLTKVIQGEISLKPVIRSLAVYSLKRTAILYPATVKPLLLTLIDNPSENPEVRIAAVSVLPFTVPTVAELQKIAVRTWYEPSRQVAAFTYSTIKSIATCNVPSLLPTKAAALRVLNIVKPIESSIQLSHNIHSSQLVEYLNLITVNGVEMVNTEESLIPNKISYVSGLHTGSWSIKGLSFHLYTQGMDHILEKLVSLSSFAPDVSQNVRSELEKIKETLQITKRETLEPEAHLSVKFMGLERLFTFNTEFYQQTVEKISQQLKAHPELFTTGAPFWYTKAEKLSEVQIIGPSDAGFPLVLESTAPAHVSIQGKVQAKTASEGSSVPSRIQVATTPVINVKLETTFGVISPLSKQFIGTGAEMSVHTSLPLETVVELNGHGQVIVTSRKPESLQKEFELLHLNVLPYTFKKSLQTIAPVCQSSGTKKVLSGFPTKNYEINPAKSALGLDMPIRVATDLPTFDLATLVRKVQAAPTVLASADTLLMPGTIRYMSFQVRMNPMTSETQELQVRFSLVQTNKTSESIAIRWPKSMKMAHEEEIKHVCYELKSGSQVEECIQKHKSVLQTVSDVSESAKRVCKLLLHLEPSASTSSPVMEKCLKSFKVCEETKTICMKHAGVRPGSGGSMEIIKRCDLKKSTCLMRRMNLHKSESLLMKMEQGSSVSVGIEASVNSHYHKNAVCAVVTGAYHRQGQKSKLFLEVDAKLPTMESPLTVQAEVDSQLPQIKTKWSKEQLLSEQLRFQSDVSVYFGLKSQPKSSLNKIHLELKGSKTPEHIEAIKASPDFAKCTQEETKGRMLAPICEKIRHQAASLNKFVLSVNTGFELRYSPLVGYLKTIVDAAMFPYVTETITGPLNPIKQFTVTANLSREGQTAFLEYGQPGMKLTARNLRMPTILKNVLPISIRNQLRYRLVQKLTGQNTPATCRVEPEFITTFDNKTYSYPLTGGCEHLLVKDCSGILPVAVTVRGAPEQKIVKIIAGQTIVELKKPQQVIVNGQAAPLTPGGPVYRKINPATGRVTLEIELFTDNAVVVREYQTNLEVAFDGKHVEVVGPQLLRSRACGLCGDMNGESSSDLRTPKMCVFKRPQIAALSYLIPSGGSCSGIPAQFKPEYEKESQRCVKKIVVPTPLLEMTERRVMVKSGPMGIIPKHMIEYRANGNQVCFSKVVIPICRQGTVPVIGHMVSTPFTCMPVHDIRAAALLSKIQANEESVELKNLPTSYTRMIEIAASCRTTPGGVNSVESSRYQPTSGRIHPKMYDH